MIQAQQNKYLASVVQTATPAQLVLMLCDGAIRFCKLGIKSLEESNNEAATINFRKVQDIISEFAITLNREAPIAESLLKLYEYFKFRLSESVSKHIVEPAQEVLGYLIELKETWMQAAKLSTAQISHG